MANPSDNCLRNCSRLFEYTSGLNMIQVLELSLPEFKTNKLFFYGFVTFYQKSTNTLVRYQQKAIFAVDA
jgi:hypothetical protein